MTQYQHLFIAIILGGLTFDIYYRFFPRRKEEEFWEKWFTKK